MLKAVPCTPAFIRWPLSCAMNCVGFLFCHSCFLSSTCTPNKKTKLSSPPTTPPVCWQLGSLTITVASIVYFLRQSPPVDTCLHTCRSGTYPLFTVLCRHLPVAQRLALEGFVVLVCCIHNDTSACQPYCGGDDEDCHKYLSSSSKTACSASPSQPVRTRVGPRQRWQLCVDMSRTEVVGRHCAPKALAKPLSEHVHCADAGEAMTPTEYMSITGTLPI